ncbi:MAG: hypothetical protein ACREQI_03380 [Candidatus Binataceae bacterium]
MKAAAAIRKRARPVRSHDGKKIAKRNDPKARLRELEKRGEVVSEARSNFGVLPEIVLAKPVRLDRIIKAAKG